MNLVKMAQLLKEQNILKYRNAVSSYPLVESPSYNILKQMIAKKIVSDDFRDINKELVNNTKNISFTQKESIYKMDQNLANTRFKTHRCKVCEIEITGSMDIVNAHMKTHFKHDGDTLETHVYF